MSLSKRIKILGPSEAPGDSPVRDVPGDYYPPGGGRGFSLTEGRDAGKKMFFRDSVHGGGEPGETIVFVHGNPESSYTFRKVIREIIARARRPCRLLAMDHIGFGLSDRAHFEMVSMDHADNLLQLVRALDLRDVTLVIHDWGGPIGLGAFLKEPERVKNLVILNSTVFPMPDAGPTYRNFPISWLGWSKTPSIIPDRLWGAFAAYSIFRSPAGPAELLLGLARCIAMARIGVVRGEEKTARKFYMDQFQAKSNVRASKRMARQSAAWGRGNRFPDPGIGERDTAPFYKFIQNRVARHWGPEGLDIKVRAVLGRWDPLGKDEVIAQWIAHLPRLRGHVRIFEDATHFIEESHPREVAETILEAAGLTRSLTIDD
ncbi:MAG: alpha/beta fold hydrolase [Desulfobacterales bacterium]|nr:alpha/beta fold hydrolase [Desulfobacterales bacterium]